jgi:hypothetical protein
VTKLPDDAHSDQIEAGRAAWARIRENGRRSFDDWILVARALAIGRSVALQEAGTDRPYGVTFTRASARWLRQAGLTGINDQERSIALLVLANLPAISAWRDGLDEAQRRRHNHPNGVFMCWRRSVRAETAKRQDVAAPKTAAQRQDVVPRVTAEAAEAARYHKPRAVYWSQDALRRAHEAMVLSRSSDLLTLATVALRAAVRNEADLIALLPPPAQVKTKKPQIAPDVPAKKPQVAPAALELHA